MREQPTPEHQTPPPRKKRLCQYPAPQEQFGRNDNIRRIGGILPACSARLYRFMGNVLPGRIARHRRTHPIQKPIEYLEYEKETATM